LVPKCNPLITAFDNPKIFKFTPAVQSGDDNVLQYMRRFYTAKKFKRIVENFRTKFPQLTLATDVIVGFPGETKEAFENTLKLLEAVKPDVVNVSKFFARPKTVAARMKDGLVDREEIKRRSTVARISKRTQLNAISSWVDGLRVLGDERQSKVLDWTTSPTKPIAS
jgi:tRNA A37 methylthiotransferase MiaB